MVFSATKMSLRKIFPTCLMLATVLNFANVSCEINLNKTSNLNENLTSPLVSCNDDENCKSILQERTLMMQKFDDYIRQTSEILNSHHSERLTQSSVIYGLVASAEESQLSQQCYNEIMQIYHGINRKEIWAMKSELKYYFWLLKKCLSNSPKVYHYESQQLAMFH